jgi:hypothetical protein
VMILLSLIQLTDHWATHDYTMTGLAFKALHELLLLSYYTAFTAETPWANFETEGGAPRYIQCSFWTRQAKLSGIKELWAWKQHW